MTSISKFGVQAPAFARFVGKPNLTIASESPADSWARERLLDAAFGAARSDTTPERRRRTRAISSAPCGCGISSPARCLRLLGPLAVAKAYRSRGLGRSLMAEALFRAASVGHKPSCSSATRLIMNPSAFPVAIRLGFLFPAPSMKRAFSGSNSKAARCKRREVSWSPPVAYRGAIEFRRAA